MPPKPPSLTSLMRQIRDWNTAHPLPGVPVIVKLDTGTLIEALTQTEAQLLGGHSAVIWLDGISGAYSLDSVRAVIWLVGISGAYSLDSVRHNPTAKQP